VAKNYFICFDSQKKFHSTDVCFGWAFVCFVLVWLFIL